MNIKDFLKSSGISSAAATTLVAAYYVFIVPQINNIQFELEKINFLLDRNEQSILSCHLQIQEFSRDYGRITLSSKEEIIALAEKEKINSIRILNLESFLFRVRNDFFTTGD